MALAFVDRPPRFLDADAVVSDNAGGARAAVAHLIVGGPSPDRLPRRPAGGVHAAERLRGYRETLAQNGLGRGSRAGPASAVPGVDAYETTADLLRGNNPPTALFTSQNLISVGAVRAVHDLGLQHEVAIVSFDDILLADALDPGLTVVAQDPRGLGRTAAELVFSRLDGYDGPSRTDRRPDRADRARLGRAAAARRRVTGCRRDGAGGRHRRDRHGLDGARAQRRPTGGCSSTSPTSGCAPDSSMAADVSDERRAPRRARRLRAHHGRLARGGRRPARRGRQRHAAQRHAPRGRGRRARGRQAPLGREAGRARASRTPPRSPTPRARAGVVTGVGFCYRFAPAVQHARALIAAGAIGEVNALPRRVPRRLRQPPRRRRLVALLARRTPAPARSAT